MAYYQESKKFNLRRMAWTFPLGLLVVFGGADLYAYVILENPASFFNFVITAIFMLLIAVTAILAIDGAKIRNYRVRLLSMIFFAVFGVVCAWIFFLALIFEVSFFTVLTDFSTYFLKLTSGFTRNGGIPYFSWLAEAAFIIGFPISFIGTSKNGEFPYCEPCDKWSEDNVSILLKLPQIYTLSELEEKIKTDGIRSFLTYERADKKDANYHEFIFFWCATCRDEMHLSVKWHHIDDSKTFDKKQSELIMNLYELESGFQREELYDGKNDSEDRFNFAEAEEQQPEKPENYDPNEFDELEEI
ncbi:MAG: hypothetical protein GQ574_15460 [Crocinitomix sp.]|nr:hypothetical protein [Crocinitomix sp.]